MWIIVHDTCRSSLYVSLTHNKKWETHKRTTWRHKSVLQHFISFSPFICSFWFVKVAVCFCSMLCREGRVITRESKGRPANLPFNGTWEFASRVLKVHVARLQVVSFSSSIPIIKIAVIRVLPFWRLFSSSDSLHEWGVERESTILSDQIQFESLSLFSPEKKMTTWKDPNQKRFLEKRRRRTKLDERYHKTEWLIYEKYGNMHALLCIIHLFLSFLSDWNIDDKVRDRKNLKTFPIILVYYIENKTWFMSWRNTNWLTWLSLSLVSTMEASWWMSSFHSLFQAVNVGESERCWMRFWIASVLLSYVIYFYLSFASTALSSLLLFLASA